MWVGEGMLSGVREGQPGIWEEKGQIFSIVVRSRLNKFMNFIITRMLSRISL